MRVRAFLTSLPVHLLPLLLLAALPAQGLSVYLHRTARPAREEVRLGDIATVVAADPQEAQAIRGLPLWRASGRAGLVPAELVKQKVAAAVDGQVVVVGARVLILPRGVAGGVELEFYTRLLEAAAALPGALAGRAELELLSKPELPPAEGGQVSFEVALEPSSANPIPRGVTAAAPLVGLFQAVYRVKAEGLEYPEARSVGVQVRQYLPVAVAVRDLPAGSVLHPTDLALEEQEIGSLSARYFGLSDRPEAFRTVAPISRGERIDPARLERHYLVRAGDTVTVVFLRPGLRISLPGRAFASGAAGDRVEVRPRDAGRRFTGRVSASGEVIVEEL